MATAVTPSIQKFSVDSSVEIRQQYPATLEKMESAHLLAYFKMKCGQSEDRHQTPLLRTFSSFAPCPIKLMMIELCKLPLDLDRLPELFTGLEQEFAILYKNYQEMDPDYKATLSKEAIEDDFIDHHAFSAQLEDFQQKLLRTKAVIPSLIKLFRSDVSQAKDLIDVYARESQVSSKSKDRHISIEIYVRNSFSRFIKRGIRPDDLPSLYDFYMNRLIDIREKYLLLDGYNRFLVEADMAYSAHTKFKCAMGEEVVREFEVIVREIQRTHSAILPTIIFCGRLLGKDSEPKVSGGFSWLQRFIS